MKSVVVQFNDKDWKYRISGKDKGVDLYEKVIQSQIFDDVKERSFLGLKFLDPKKGEYRWLSAEKTLKSCPDIFILRFLYFPDNPDEEIRRKEFLEVLFKQLKECQMEGTFFCPDERKSHFNLMASMATDEDGVKEYLRELKSLEMYGTTCFKCNDESGSGILIGIHSKGIKFYEASHQYRPKESYTWDEIVKVRFDTKHFIVTLADKNLKGKKLSGMTRIQMKNCFDLITGNQQRFVASHK